MPSPQDKNPAEVAREAPPPAAPLRAAVPPTVSMFAVDRDSIITVDGQMGVFTPLTRPHDAAPDPKADDNVHTILTLLKTEVASLRQENASLAAQVTKVRAPPRSPEDFASAVRRSLDKLQSQLATMSNPVSNFAVKEFRLEANVRVEVTALGDVAYRFLDVRDNPDPATLSRITLDVVPIPKTTTQGVFTPDRFDPGRSVSDIEGVTPALQAKLHQNQIDTIGDLLAAGTRARSAVALAGLLKVDRAKLAAWLSSAELLTLRGIDSGRAAVLELAGVRSLAALAALTPDELTTRFKEALAKSERADVAPLSADDAPLLIKAARAYLGQKDG